MALRGSTAIAAAFLLASTATATPSATCDLDPKQGTWCVVSPDAKHDPILAALNYVCSDGGVDCKQCTSTDLKTQTTWAINQYFLAHIKSGASACDFNGVGKLVQPRFSKCLPSEAYANRCLPDTSANSSVLVAALSYICSGGNLDCTSINAGGPCVYSTSSEVLDKCAWAFDQYYQAHVGQGAAACNFNGAAKIEVPPCGQYNKGNPKTGTGYAYMNSSYCLDPAADKCGCIQKPNTTMETGCQECQTVSGLHLKCPHLCPWDQQSSSAKEEDLLETMLVV